MKYLPIIYNFSAILKEFGYYNEGLLRSNVMRGRVQGVQQEVRFMEVYAL